MLNTNITTFRKNVFTMLEQTIRYNETLNISTKDGNAIILSEDDYRSLMETVNLLSIPGMRDKLQSGREDPLEDCVPESEVAW